MGKQLCVHVPGEKECFAEEGTLGMNVVDESVSEIIARAQDAFDLRDFLEDLQARQQPAFDRVFPDVSSLLLSSSFCWSRRDV